MARKVISVEVDVDVFDFLASRAKDADRSLAAEVRRILNGVVRGEVSPRQQTDRLAPTPETCRNIPIELPVANQRCVIGRKEAAALLGVSVGTLDRLARSGELLGLIQISPRRVGYRRAALIDWIEEKAKAGMKVEALTRENELD